MHVLVDYDNVKSRRERNQLDVQTNLQSLVEEVQQVVSSVLPGVKEIRLRLYGGWRDERGSPSRNATWLASVIGQVRGRRNGVRILPTIVVSLLCRPSRDLLGTVRYSARLARQKMVDAMLSVDVVHLADGANHVVIVSDDDDLVPGCMAAACRASQPTHLLRRRRGGTGLNDEALIDCGVLISVL